MVEQFIKEGCKHLLAGTTLSEHEKQYLLPYFKEILTRIYQVASETNTDPSTILQKLPPFTLKEFSLANIQNYLTIVENYLLFNVEKSLQKKYQPSSTPADLQSLNVATHVLTFITKILPEEQTNLTNLAFEKDVPSFVFEEQKPTLERLKRIDHSALARFTQKQIEKIICFISLGLCHEKVINHLSPNEFDYLESMCFINFIKNNENKLSEAKTQNQLYLAFPYLQSLPTQLLSNKKSIYNLINRGHLFISQLEPLIVSNKIDILETLLERCVAIFRVRLSTNFLLSFSQQAKVSEVLTSIQQISTYYEFKNAVENQIFDPVVLFKLSPRAIYELQERKSLRELFFNKIITIEELEHAINNFQSTAYTILEDKVILDCIATGLIHFSRIGEITSDINTEAEKSLSKTKAGIFYSSIPSSLRNERLQAVGCELEKDQNFPFKKINFKNAYAMQALQQDVIVLIAISNSSFLEYINQINHPFVLSILKKDAPEYLSDIHEGRISMDELNNMALTAKSEDELGVKVNQTVVARKINNFEEKKQKYTQEQIDKLSKNTRTLEFALEHPNVKDVIFDIDFNQPIVLDILVTYPEVIWSDRKKDLILALNQMGLGTLVILNSPIIFDLFFSEILSHDIIKYVACVMGKDEEYIDNVKILDELLSYPELQTTLINKKVLLDLTKSLHPNLAIAFKEELIRKFIQQELSKVSKLSTSPHEHDYDDVPIFPFTIFQSYVPLNEQQLALIFIPEIYSMLEKNPSDAWNKLSRLDNHGVELLAQKPDEQKANIFLKRFTQNDLSPNILNQLSKDCVKQLENDSAFHILHQGRLTAQQFNELHLHILLFLENSNQQNHTLAKMFFENQISVGQINQLKHPDKITLDKAVIDFFASLPQQRFWQLPDANNFIFKLIKNDENIQKQIKDETIVCSDLNRIVAECIQIKLKYMLSTIEEHIQVQKIKPTDVEKKYPDLKKLKTTLEEILQKINANNFNPDEFATTGFHQLNGIAVLSSSIPGSQLLATKLNKYASSIQQLFTNPELKLEDIVQSHLRTQHAGVRLSFKFYKDRTKMQKKPEDLNTQKIAFKAMQMYHLAHPTNLDLIRDLQGCVDGFFKETKNNKDFQEAKAFKSSYQVDFSTAPHFFQYLGKKEEANTSENVNNNASPPTLVKSTQDQ